MPVLSALKNLKFRLKYAGADDSKDSDNMNPILKSENRDKMLKPCHLSTQ